MDFMSGLEKFGFNASDMGDIFADENGGSSVRKTEAEKKEVEELKEKQLNLEAELSQCRGECTEAGEDA